MWFFRKWGKTWIKNIKGLAYQVWFGVWFELEQVCLLDQASIEFNERRLGGVDELVTVLVEPPLSEPQVGYQSSGFSYVSKHTLRVVSQSSFLWLRPLLRVPFVRWWNLCKFGSIFFTIFTEYDENLKQPINGLKVLEFVRVKIEACQSEMKWTDARQF